MTVDMTTSDVLPDRFLALASQLAAFQSRHGRLPVQCDAHDPYERYLGDFLRVQRRHLTLHLRGEFGGTVAARVAHLDSVVPDWRSANLRRDRTPVQNLEFSTRVHAAAQFVNRHGRLPASTSASPDERQLGTFLVNMRQASQGRGTVVWNSAREEVLDRELPGWSENPNNTFGKRLSELQVFVAENGRPPRRHKGPLAEQPEELRRESSLRNFIEHTRTRKNEARIQALEMALAA